MLIAIHVLVVCSSVEGSERALSERYARGCLARARVRHLREVAAAFRGAFELQRGAAPFFSFAPPSRAWGSSHAAAFDVFCPRDAAEKLMLFSAQSENQPSAPRELILCSASDIACSILLVIFGATTHNINWIT